MMYMYTDTTKADYTNYLKLLSDSGFSCHDSHDIAGNLHAAYIKKGYGLVQAYYTPDNAAVRIVMVHTCTLTFCRYLITALTEQPSEYMKQLV